MNAIRVTKAHFPKNTQWPRIQRKARTHFIARRSLPRFELQLTVLPTSDWPPHLSAAWTILNKELELPDPKARSIVLQSISAAHNCVRAQSQQLHDIVVARARTTIHDACRRIANCIKRAPAWLRRHLDQAMLSPIRESMIDLEVIESIFALATVIFEEFPTAEPSRAALKALSKIEEAHFDALGIKLRGKVEGSITDLVANSTMEHPVRAADVFDTIATALDGEKIPKMSSQSRKLITTYVAGLAEIWQQAGLKPSRAIAYLDDTYRSKFHRFAELILTAMAAPWALQYDLRKLPDEREPWKAMQRVGHHWLVSDDHVREALRQIQILVPKTP
jgi:hypothetical protein